MLFRGIANRGPRGILCTRREKAHTSKRESIIAPDNVISKAQCAPHRPEGLPRKSDVAMFLPADKAIYLCHNEPAAAMSLRRDFYPTGK